MNEQQPTEAREIIRAQLRGIVNAWIECMKGNPNALPEKGDYFSVTCIRPSNFTEVALREFEKTPLIHMIRDLFGQTHFTPEFKNIAIKRIAKKYYEGLPSDALLARFNLISLRQPTLGIFEPGQEYEVEKDDLDSLGIATLWEDLTNEWWPLGGEPQTVISIPGVTKNDKHDPIDEAQKFADSLRIYFTDEGEQWKMPKDLPSVMWNDLVQEDLKYIRDKIAVADAFRRKYKDDTYAKVVDMVRPITQYILESTPQPALK